LDLYSCFLLPAYTLLFADSVTWIRTNFSVRAVTGLGHYRALLLWGLLLSVYYGILLGRMAMILPRSRMRVMEFLLLGAALLSLTLGLPIPYLPETYPHLADLHVLFTFSAGISLLAALLLLILAFQRGDRGGRILLRIWCAIVAVSCTLLLSLGMVSSGLEVFLVLSTVWLTRQLWLRRYRIVTES
jgi:hypothetical protein